MINRRSGLLLLVDLLLVLVSTIGAIAIRDDFVVSLERLRGSSSYILLSLGVAALAILAFGQHRTIWRMTSRVDYQRMVCVAVVTVAGAMALSFVIERLDGVPRSLPLLQFVLMLQLMAAPRAIVRLAHLRRSRSMPMPDDMKPVGEQRSHALLIGLNPMAELYLRTALEVGREEVEVVGILGRTRGQVGRLALDCPVLGKPEDVEQVLRDLAIEGIDVDRIVITMPVHKLSDEVRETLRKLETTKGITVHPLANAIGLGPRALADVRQGASAGVEYSTAERALVQGNRYLAMKRVIDVVGALVLLLLAAPLLALVTVLALVDVGAPVIFAQKRPGRFGRTFRVYKFRTMAPAFDAAGRRVDDAERSSWIGSLLRRTRLDELPQLYNVLIGDMSFVGPRPLLPVDQRPEYKARLLVRPGITGWAQVEGGRIVSAADKAAMDVWYVKKASLALDLRILLRTGRMVVAGDRVNASAIEQAWRDMAPTGICAGWQREPTGTEQLAGGKR